MDILIHQYGYLLIFVITFFEGESVLIIAGMIAHQGLLNLGLCVLSAFLGSVIGDQLFFHLARQEGYDFVKRFKYISAVLPRAEELVKRHGSSIVLFSRYIYGLRTALIVMCGLGKMPSLKFTVLNAISGLIWAVSYGFLGYFFSEAISAVAGLRKVEFIIVAAIAVAALVFWIVRITRSKRLAGE